MSETVNINDFPQIDRYNLVSLIGDYVEILNKAIEFLVNNVNHNVKITDDEVSLRAIGFTYELSRYKMYSQRPNSVDVFVGKKFHLVLSTVTFELVQIFNDLKTGNDKSNEMFGKTPEAIKNLLDETQNILNFCVSASVNFRLNFFNAGGAKALFGLLVNKEFVESFHHQTSFDVLIMNINWLSKDADQFKNEWLELNAANVILPIARNYPICKLPGNL